MEETIVTLEKGTKCTAWNFSGHRFAAGLDDGSVVVYDSIDPHSSAFSPCPDLSVLKIIWVPPKYGDAVACLGEDGSLVLWEEVMKDKEDIQWEMRYHFDGNKSKIVDAQFGDEPKFLKLATALADGEIKIYELTDIVELDKWQLQAEFYNVCDVMPNLGNTLCLSASISWNPKGSEVRQSSFVVGFNSNIPSLNSSKVWEYDLDHQRWLPVADLSLPEDKEPDQVYAVSWAPNIGRPFELIAVASSKGLSIWHLDSNPDLQGRLSTHRVAMLAGHEGQVWQMEWDVSGMTLATAGADGMVRLWQSDLNGRWLQQGVLTPT